MPTVAERVSVVEVQVANLDEKIDEIKVDVNQMSNGITRRLDQMYDASCSQHAELANSIKSTHNELSTKITELEHFKSKWSYLILGAVAALGWATHVDFKSIAQMFGF
jgi:hypothetical protein